MSTCDTLFIKNAPSIPRAAVCELLSHYGGKEFISLADGTVWLVRYENKESAEQALYAMQNLRVLDSVLDVSFYHPKDAARNAEIAGDPIPVVQESKEAAPIAPKLGIDYAPNPHLEYSYPPVDDEILCNILNAIQNVPKLYTQVLHLMNKMNLPPPFRSVPSSVHTIDYPHLKKKLRNKIRASKTDLLSSDESELSDEMEEQRNPKRSPIAHSTVLEPPRKRQKIDDNVALPSGFKEKTKKRDTAIKISLDIDKGSKSDETSCHINRWTLEDILEKFPKYSQGIPSNKLYIKNIAKTVTQDDLRGVFKQYEEGGELIIDLKAKGRMRGQAFVTFPSLTQATRALEQTNGIIQGGKALIMVCYNYSFDFCFHRSRSLAIRKKLIT